MNDDANIRTTSQQAAMQIYQAALDALSDAVMRFDPTVLTERVGFPFRMSTYEQEFLIESAEDWLECAEMFHRNLKSLGVNHYIRLVTEADFLSENYIEGRHVTHTLRNATPVVPSYDNLATLTRIGGEWRFTQMNSAIGNDRWPIAIPKVDVTKKQNWPMTDPASDIRRTDASPLTLYQSYLDRLTETNMTDDFDGWCALCHFPHTVHIEQIDETIERPEQIEPFFAMLREQIEAHDIDRFERRGIRAEFISASHICGYHEARLFSGDTLKIGPVSSRYILKRNGTDWRMASVTNSIANTEFPYSLPELGERLVSLRHIQERTARK